MPYSTLDERQFTNPSSARTFCSRASCRQNLAFWHSPFVSFKLTGGLANCGFCLRIKGDYFDWFWPFTFAFDFALFGDSVKVVVFAQLMVLQGFREVAMSQFLPTLSKKHPPI